MREMIDATAHEATMAAVARGEQEMLAAEATVAPPTTLGFLARQAWSDSKATEPDRRRLASYIADLEAGRRKGDAALLERLAQALRLRMEDLVAEEVLAEPASRPKKEMAP
jgi:transcriptional regulator with XRE-family HTH domain